jgi:hypothetical protein
MIAIGHHGSNGRLADQGKRGLMAALIGALIAGAATAIITFGFNVGSGL